MHSGMVRSFSTSALDKIKVIDGAVRFKGCGDRAMRSGRPQGRTQAAMDQVAENDVKTLNVAFDDYPQTRALKSGAVKSDRVTLNFSDIKPANRFFKPMVRELKFDISEMAIATYMKA